jgi:hypothetical protein
MGAVLSIGLVVGVGYWAYQMLTQDVGDIPVVRATQGPVREAPQVEASEDQASSLSVSQVAANDVDSLRVDQVRLAPAPTSLADTDTPALREPKQLVQISGNEEQDVSGPKRINVNNLVRQITAGQEPLLQNAVAEAPETEATSIAMAAAPKPIASLGKTALRPKAKPAFDPAAYQTSAPVQAAVSSATEIEISAIAAGTALAQIGAFDSAEVARDQWDKIQGKFFTFFEGKSRVIQKATSSGRTFYRLRAAGFEDIADARRFCSAMQTRQVDCIPVTYR